MKRADEITPSPETDNFEIEGQMESIISEIITGISDDITNTNESSSMELRNNPVEVELENYQIVNQSKNLTTYVDDHPNDRDKDSGIDEGDDRNSYSFPIKYEPIEESVNGTQKGTNNTESNQEILSDSEPTENYRNYSIEDLADVNDLLKGFDSDSSDKQKDDSHSVQIQIKKERLNQELRKKSKKKRMKKNKRSKKGCNQCEACLRPPCDKCVPCLDLPRNNGPGKLRRKCELRICFKKRQDNKEKKSDKILRRGKRDIKTKVRKSSQNTNRITSLTPAPSLFLCPVPECEATFSNKNSRRTHIASHFKSLILKEYRYRKNSPCPKCEKSIKGNVSNYITHMAYVHHVVGQLLPKNDKRRALVRKYLP